MSSQKRWSARAERDALAQGVANFLKSWQEDDNDDRPFDELVEELGRYYESQGA